jgi:predicted transposase YdaD
MNQRKQKLTMEQVTINVGWAAKWEAKGRVEGEARGRVEGEAKGRVEGEVKGRVEGEAKGRVSIAQNMVNMGLPFETVVCATQLEPEKVKALYQCAPV